MKENMAKAAKVANIEQKVLAIIALKQVNQEVARREKIASDMKKTSKSKRLKKYLAGF